MPEPKEQAMTQTATATPRKPRKKMNKQQRKEIRQHRKTVDALIAATAPVSIKPDASIPLNGKARVEQPYVARCMQAPDGGRCAIVLRRAHNSIYCIQMDGAGLRVQRMPMRQFDESYKPYDYNVQKAARSFLDWGEKYSGITDVTRDALIAITKGAVDMSSIEETSTKQSEPTKPKASNNGATAKTAKAKTKVKAKMPKKSTSLRAGTDKETKKPSKAVVTKTAKSTKPAKEKKAAAGRIDKTLKIYKISKENPRREGGLGYESFKLYRDGMTVEKYLELEGAGMGHLNWDVDHNFIKLK